MSLWGKPVILTQRLGRTLFRDYTSSPTIVPPWRLLGDLCERIANLEHQLRQLAEQQRRLQNLQTLLRMSESFKILHRILFQEGATPGRMERRHILRVLMRHNLGVEDLSRTMDICRLRNEAAHPNELPDLTEVDPELTRVYEKVQRLLAEIIPPSKKKVQETGWTSKKRCA